MDSPERAILVTPAQRKAVADLSPKLADRLKLDEKNPRKFSFTAKELEAIRDKVEAARPRFVSAESGTVSGQLEETASPGSYGRVRCRGPVRNLVSAISIR